MGENTKKKKKVFTNAPRSPLLAKMRGNEFQFYSWMRQTTSTSNKDAYLICYVRFIDNDDNIVEDLPLL